jgi:DNA-binding NarL/FixJ family response regulator
MARSNGKARTLHPISVLIADDHRSFGEAMGIALSKEDDLSIIQVAEGGEEAVRIAVDSKPDVVLMDLRMPGTDGIEATARMRHEGSRSAVIILTGEGDQVALGRAIQAGARGFMWKTAPVAEIAKAIRKAHKGEPLHRPEEVNQAFKVMRARTRRDQDLRRRVERLSPRELEILQAMAEGASPQKIISKLGISGHTLRTHTQNILTKLAVHSKTEAVVAAIRMGKATPPGLAHPGPDAGEAGPESPGHAPKVRRVRAPPTRL